MSSPGTKAESDIGQQNLPGILITAKCHKRENSIKNRVDRPQVIPPNLFTKSLRSRLPETIGPYVHKPNRYSDGQDTHVLEQLWAILGNPNERQSRAHTPKQK
jgi:hypothetical protein